MLYRTGVAGLSEDDRDKVVCMGGNSGADRVAKMSGNARIDLDWRAGHRSIISAFNQRAIKFFAPELLPLPKAISSYSPR